MPQDGAKCLAPFRRHLSRREVPGTFPPPAEPEEAEDDRELIGKRIVVSKLVARAVDRLADETFGAARVAAEVNRRYRDKLRKLVDARAVSVTLRRLRDAGHLQLVRQGKAAHEALYAKATRKQA